MMIEANPRSKRLPLLSQDKACVQVAEEALAQLLPNLQEKATIRQILNQYLFSPTALQDIHSIRHYLNRLPTENTFLEEFLSVIEGLKVAVDLFGLQSPKQLNTWMERKKRQHFTKIARSITYSFVFFPIYCLSGQL
ncbi:MAG: hypothetical protein AAGI49_16825 [Bacteroidota bacterium]